MTKRITKKTSRVPGVIQPQSTGDERLYRIVYSSQAREEISYQEAEMIFRRGQANNESERLTGCLIFSQGRFVQVLEGPRFQCEGTFRRITRDSRHFSIDLLFSDYIEARHFDGFSMKNEAAIDELFTTLLKSA